FRQPYRDYLYLPSFPTRRSADLVDHLVGRVKAARYRGVLGINIGKNFDTAVEDATSDYLICLNKVYEHATYITVNISSPNTPGLDRKSTRLNSSHVKISYAVFCL